MQAIEDKQTKFLSALSALLYPTSAIEVFLRTVFELLDRYYGINCGMLNLYVPEEDLIVTDIVYGCVDSTMSQSRYKPGEGIIGTVFLTGKSVVVPTGGESGFLKTIGVRVMNEPHSAFMCMPINVFDKTIGTISVIIQKSANDCSDEFRILFIVSKIISQAVNARRAHFLKVNIENTLEKLNVNAQKTSTLEEMSDMFIKEIIIDQLKLTKGNITRAARNLGTTKRILNYKIKLLGIDFKKYKESSS